MFIIQATDEGHHTECIFLSVLFLNVLLPNATLLNVALQNDILVNVVASFKLIFHLALIALTFSLKVLKKSNWFASVISKFPYSILPHSVIEL
jgi:hypothetical protein